MSYELALRLLEIGLAGAVIQRGLEHLRADTALAAAQILVALALMTGIWSLPASVALWVLGLAQLYRFQGPYNGGADKMLLLAITCLALAHAVPGWGELALSYLAVQVVLSYAVSGWVKLRNPDWRSGQALCDVFAFSAYPVSEGLRRWADRPGTLRLAARGVIGFELALPAALLSSATLAGALIVAAGFHLANACLFGLNRFVWAWIATYPVLFWFQGRFF